jgi:LAO/AO transport system kinase
LTPKAIDPLEALRAGGKRAMAMALARVEAAPGEPHTLALLDAAYGGALAHVVGITGPPGVGKSSLIARLIGTYRTQGRAVGVIAIDPSSRRAGGALLGDRARIEADPEDPGVFIRSMAARGRLGGLAPFSQAAVVLMRAVYDVVIVETVGVGQSETEIASVSDTVVLCIQPASGDSLQYMKAGIIEFPDVAVVTKSDLGRPALRARKDLEAGLALAARDSSAWSIAVMMVSCTDGSGIEELTRTLAAHAAWLAAEDRLERLRHGQAEAWLAAAVREEFGRFGLRRADRLQDGLTLAPGEAPFRRLRRLTRVLGSESADVLS